MTDPPNLDLVNLVVSDMEATVAFYRRLGLSIPDTDAAFQTHHRAAQVPGGVDLHFDSTDFAHHWAKGWTTGARVVVGFKVASREGVDAIYSDLTGAGYRGLHEPYDAFWGARYAIVEDPDGNAVGIMSPVDPARRSDAGFP
jgi:catechol 2,3-dioxygenase-like lactoylglutathione lyase family enzyme